MFEVIVWQPLGLLTTVKPLALPGRYDFLHECPRWSKLNETGRIDECPKVRTTT